MTRVARSCCGLCLALPTFPARSVLPALFVPHTSSLPKEGVTGTLSYIVFVLPLCESRTQLGRVEFSFDIRQGLIMLQNSSLASQSKILAAVRNTSSPRERSLIESIRTLNRWPFKVASGSQPIRLVDSSRVADVSSVSFVT